MQQAALDKGSNETVAPYPRPAQAWATVFILLLLYITSLLDRNILTLLGEEIRKDMELTDLDLSLLYGPAFAISYAVGALPLGWAIDRYSRRWVLWAGVTVWSFATMAAGLSRNMTQLFTSRIFVGAGEAVLVPGTQSILADMFPPDRLAFPISIYSLGSKIGQGGSLLIGGLLTAIIAPGAIFLLPLVGELKGWHVILIIVGMPGLLLALFIFLLPEPVRRKVSSGSSSAVGYRHFLAYVAKNPHFFIGLFGGVAVSSIATSAVMAWSPAFFTRAHHLPMEQVGLWLGIALVAGPVIGLPLHGLITDRLFRGGMGDAHMRYAGIMCLIGAVPFAAAFTFTDAWLGFILVSLGVTACGVIPVLGSTALQLMVPGDMRGKAASILLLITSIAGLSLGPTIAAWISQEIFNDPESIGTALAICATIFLPITTAFFWLTLKPLRAAYSQPR